MRPREPLPSPEQPDVWLEIGGGGSQLVTRWALLWEGVRFQEDFFLLCASDYFLSVFVKPQVHVGKLNGGRCLHGAPSEAKLLPQSKARTDRAPRAGPSSEPPPAVPAPAPRMLRKPPSSARAAPAPCVLGCRGSPRRSRRERRGRRTAAKRGNPVNGNKGRVFSSAQPSELMFPPLE